MDTNRNSAPAASALYPAGNLGAMGERLGLDAKPAPQASVTAAAWPVGVSLLAQMVDACQRCNAEPVCNDWLLRAPEKIASPPAFCPNGDALKQAKR